MSHDCTAMWIQSPGIRMDVLVVLLLAVFPLAILPLDIEDPEVAKAINTLGLHGVELESFSFDSTHLGDLGSRDDLPKAYDIVLKSMLQEAELCDPEETYRRADGVCNNVKNPLWGASLDKQVRLLPNQYHDKQGIPRIQATNDSYLPSARTVSLNCFPPNKETFAFLDRKATQMTMQWGQYIDHDMVFTEVMQGADCCKNPKQATCIHPHIFNNGPCFPIGIEEGDRFFNGSCMPFQRSFAIKVNGIREQINGATSFIDASTVYGSHQTLQNDLRTMVDGKLKVIADSAYGGHLPQNNTFKCRRDLLHGGGGDGCRMAGDRRVNVFAGLTITHLLFVREHNRIADKIKKINTHWGDERIFQEVRKIVAALHQKITYEEWLPHILGPQAMDFFGLLPGNYSYDPEINPSIINEFSTAAFRFGHSQINKFLTIKGKRTRISDTYFQPWQATGSERQIKSIMKEQCRMKCQRADRHFTQEVTDLLFKDQDKIGLSTDLAARNVQRGRDHGIQPYLPYFDLAVQEFLAKINAEPLDLNIPECFQAGIYGSTADIDLFTGAMDEAHMEGGQVGPTFAFMLGKQFQNLKYGDRFFFETTEGKKGFTPNQLKEIKNQTLSSVICRNTDTDYLQRDVFVVKHMDKNPYRACDTYADFDFSHWKETPPFAPLEESSTASTTSETPDTTTTTLAGQTLPLP